MRRLLVLGVTLVALAGGCGGKASDQDKLVKVADEHPTWVHTVCTTLNQYGYDLTLRAARRDWAKQLRRRDVTPKQALDYFISRCD